MGTNQIGAIADTGLDVTSCYFSDPYSKVTFSTINNPIYNKSARKVIQYASVPLYSDNFDVVNGHGTHTVGTMVGSVTSSNADYATSKLFCVVLCCVVLCCVVLCCVVLYYVVEKGVVRVEVGGTFMILYIENAFAPKSEGKYKGGNVVESLILGWK